jgi:signal transduction histidine kinase/CheY-like chemotaxis protein
VNKSRAYLPGRVIKIHLMKKAFLIPVFLIILSAHVLYAQSGLSERDSLRLIVFNNSLSDSTRFTAGERFIKTYSHDMPDSMLYFARILYKESVKANYLPGIIFFTYAEGWYCTVHGKKDEALKYYLACLKPAEEYGQPRLLAYAYYGVGMGYMDLFLADKAIEYLLRAIKIYRELKTPNAPLGLLSSLGTLASVYSISGNPRKAIEVNLQMIALVDSLKIQGTNHKAGALYNLGIMYGSIGKPLEQIRSYHEALKLDQQNNYLVDYYVTLEGMAYFFMGDTLNLYGKEIGDNRKSIDIAIAYLGELESMYRNMQDSSKLALNLVQSARVYMRKGEKKTCLDKVHEAEGLKLNVKDFDSRMFFARCLGEIYNGLGNYKKAMNHYLDLVNLKDSINSVKMAEKVSLLTESFEIEQMEGQLSQKEQQLAKNRTITYLFIAVSGLILILAGIVFYFLRQKQKAAKLLEHQNREIEKARYRAEQSEKFKERFLASMSHEIRTPLNAVIGMTGLLLDDPQPPKTGHYLRNIKQAGEHLTGIINQVLDLSRIDAGKLELHEAPFNMKELLEEIENLLSGKAKEKGLQLIVHKENEIPDWVHGDAGRIRQILLNLADNAIKFTEQGSVLVQLTAGEVKENKAQVGFSVEDTGPGIPKELQAEIYEEFVQLGKSQDQRIVGTGLGLSIARKLVERMGGILALESEPGKGSVFRFSIPLVLSTEEAYRAYHHEKESAALVMKGSYRILVVEDNASNQIVIEGLLEKILPESSVILADDGYKALAMLEKEKFDLVLMDIRMPGIDGYETTKRLRLLGNENANIPVIALTASVIRSDVQHCLDAGMNGYVPKPISRAFLAKILQEQLKITTDEFATKQPVDLENFLSGISAKPEWSLRLYEICEGEKDRFIQYLDILLKQSEAEIANWQTWIDQQQNQPLAFSIHKLLPHIRNYMNEKCAAMAALLDLELRKGWSENHSENILSLKREILALHKEASELLQVLEK